MIKMNLIDDNSKVLIYSDYQNLMNLAEAIVNVSEIKEQNQIVKYGAVASEFMSMCKDVIEAINGEKEVIDLPTNSPYCGHSKTDRFYGYQISLTNLIFNFKIIDNLIDIYKQSFKGKQYISGALISPKAVYNQDVLTLRTFQLAFTNCIKEFLSPTTFAIWYKIISNPSVDMSACPKEYINHLNEQLLNISSKEDRIKKLNSLTRDICNHEDAIEYN